MLVVVAVGGNAILRKGEKPSVSGQMRNIAKLGGQIAQLAKKHHMVITHGNGPQIGNILIRAEEALGKAYPLPLYACVAESQGEIGFMMEQSLQNELKKHGVRRNIATILTQTLINRHDKSLKKPTKPIGPFYSRKEAARLAKQGIHLAKDPRGGYRRVVPSPLPLSIVEAGVIKKMVRNNIIVIAAGGGGIPVYRKGGQLHGLDAVIDKDMASACLAKSVSADVLMILTDVDAAYLNYRKPGQKKIARIKARKLKEYMKGGYFPAGSMGPKVQACIDFLEHGKMAIITNPENALKALRGKSGTVVTR